MLSQHNCHIAVFDDVIQWAMHWNNNNTYFDKNDVYQFQSYNIFFKLYDMQCMKPTQKTIAISNTSNDTVAVKLFDFKQQLLSLLRDEELMNLSNLVPTNLPDKTPNIKNDITSDFDDSNWYNCTQDIMNIQSTITSLSRLTNGKFFKGINMFFTLICAHSHYYPSVITFIKYEGTLLMDCIVIRHLKMTREHTCKEH